MSHHRAKSLVVRGAEQITPDQRRVIPLLFVPGHEALIHGESRAMPVIERVLAMDDDDVARTIEQIFTDYSPRYHDFRAVLEKNYSLVAHRLGEDVALAADRRLVVGAYFTREYAFEAAALFNPSIVAHPDQTGVQDGELRFVMSLRAVGEGHLSSIEFRTGTVSARAELRFDTTAEVADCGRQGAADYDRELLRAVLAEDGEDDENARFVWDSLPECFGADDLEVVLANLGRQRATRRAAHHFVDKVRRAAACNYTTEFDPATSLSERLLWPYGPAEGNGMEDARFVRFVDDGIVAYYATYTAFDGSHVAPQLIETQDFITFRMTQLAGPSAKNKGLALFPRKVNGHYAALSRWDRENNAISYSDDGRRWGAATTIQTPGRPWELVQLGNCGSPIETSAGWLVFTHGVGPMREYAISAVLLELDNPAVMISALREPLLTPLGDERVGYVPNVVYSCGALLHGDTLTLPYGCSDSSIRVATLHLPTLLDELLGPPNGSGRALPERPQAVRR